MAKCLMVTSVLAAMFAVTGRPADAQARSWCLYETASDGGGAINCGFHSFAQCQASRPGGSSHCVPNPAASAADRLSTDGSQTSGRERRR
jgi:Protein of unknown function (DUF3551)